MLRESPSKAGLLRGIGIALAALFLAVPVSTLAQTSCDDAVFPAEMTCTPDGNAVILDNDDPDANGVIDLSAVTGGYTFNNNAGATWEVGGSSGTINSLGAGTINNAGTIDIGSGAARRVVSAAGTTFTGTGASLLVMNISQPGNTARTSCSAATVSAGCLDLSGGATAGQTAIDVGLFVSSGALLADPLGVANPGIVLVDVSGGTSAADHFVLDPGSANYAVDSTYGAVLDRGRLLDYALLYNPGTQQHILASVPQREAIEYATFIHEAMSIWHVTSDVIVGRQADLRKRGARAERGGWLRIASARTERDATLSMTTHGNTFTYDSDYKLDTRTLIAGYDLAAADNYVMGLHVGIVDARQEFDASSSRDETRGATLGAYAGWWNEAGLTLDGTLNANMLTIDHSPQGDFEKSESNARSFGLRAEAGWRLPLSEAFYVQPLATVAYVRANIEELNLRHYDLAFDDEESKRAGLGARIGGDMNLSAAGRLNYWLVARAWEEYAEDGNVQYKTGGEPLTIEDDISESFEEVGLGVSLTSPDENLEVFLSGNVRSGDHTDGNNVTIGARLNW